MLVLFSDSHAKDIHFMALCGVLDHYSRWYVYLPRDFEQFIRYDYIKMNSAYLCIM
jgi:hypothetical protein